MFISDLHIKYSILSFSGFDLETGAIWHLQLKCDWRKRNLLTLRNYLTFSTLDEPCAIFREKTHTTSRSRTQHATILKDILFGSKILVALILKNNNKVYITIYLKSSLHYFDMRDIVYNMP